MRDRYVARGFKHHGTALRKLQHVRLAQLGAEIRLRDTRFFMVPWSIFPSRMSRMGSFSMTPSHFTERTLIAAMVAWVPRRAGTAALEMKKSVHVPADVEFARSDPVATVAIKSKAVIFEKDRSPIIRNTQAIHMRETGPRIRIRRRASGMWESVNMCSDFPRIPHARRRS